MNFSFDESLATGYKSSSQRIRVMSENWVQKNIYCPICGNPHLSKEKNNKPVSDFKCEICGETFELKSKCGHLGNKISDGAYKTMIKRITGFTNPNLFVMEYSEDLEVMNLLFIPKFFFTPEIIEKRKPLSNAARRAGWVGCNIEYCCIPAQGKISIITSQHIQNKDDAIFAYDRIKSIKTNNLYARGWLFDILNCINKIPENEFTIEQMYSFEKELKSKHPQNQHIKEKIRQQLQVLRDKSIIKFRGRGLYEKLF